MNIKLKHAFSSTIFLKAVSLVIGFLFWSILSQSFTTNRWVTIPVAYYNKGTEKIEAADTVKVELKGRRSHLKNIDESTLSLHIDAQNLKPGPNTIEVTPENLFLPATIGVGEIIPHNITIHVSQGSSS